MLKIKYLTVVLSCLALSGCYVAPYNDGVAPYSGAGGYPAYENYYAPTTDPVFFSANYYSVGYGRNYGHDYHGGGYYHGAYRNGGYHAGNAGTHVVGVGGNSRTVSGGSHAGTSSGGRGGNGGEHH